MSSSILTLRNSLFSPTTNANSNSVGFPTSKTPTTNTRSRNVFVLKIEANKNKYESDEEAFVREGSEQDVNQTKSQTKKRLMKIPIYASMNPIKTTRILQKKQDLKNWMLFSIRKKELSCQKLQHQNKKK